MLFPFFKKKKIVVKRRVRKLFENKMSEVKK